MLIDTHCHLDAAEFDADRDAVLAQAVQAGVKGVVLPAVAPDNFQAVRQLAHRVPGGAYALGIHPLFVLRVPDHALTQLREALLRHHDDPRLVAVGEIGLDRFVPELQQPQAWQRQLRFYQAQLQLAAEFGLPVILHVRRAVDVIAQALRRLPRLGGIAHAFNGSQQQAQVMVGLGLALGIGGAMTYPRALQIRRLAAGLPLQNLVLETDAPDMSPAWLWQAPRRNTPAQVAGVAAALAELRNQPLSAVVAATGAAALAHLPRLGQCVLPGHAQ